MSLETHQHIENCSEDQKEVQNFFCWFLLDFSSWSWWWLEKEKFFDCLKSPSASTCQYQSTHLFHLQSCTICTEMLLHPIFTELKVDSIPSIPEKSLPWMWLVPLRFTSGTFNVFIQLSSPSYNFHMTFGSIKTIIRQGAGRLSALHWCQGHHSRHPTEMQCRPQAMYHVPYLFLWSVAEQDTTEAGFYRRFDGDYL